MSSMIPKFPPGTLLVDTPTKPNDLRVGDVATYQIASVKLGGTGTGRPVDVGCIVSRRRVMSVLRDETGNTTTSAVFAIAALVFGAMIVGVAMALVHGVRYERSGIGVRLLAAMPRWLFCD